jgi:hypothetical protein
LAAPSVIGDIAAGPISEKYKDKFEPRCPAPVFNERRKTTRAAEYSIIVAAGKKKKKTKQY